MNPEQTSTSAGPSDQGQDIVNQGQVSDPRPVQTPQPVPADWQQSFAELLAVVQKQGEEIRLMRQQMFNTAVQTPVAPPVAVQLFSQYLRHFLLQCQLYNLFLGLEISGNTCTKDSGNNILLSLMVGLIPLRQSSG